MLPSLSSIRQTAAELLGCALCDLFPGTQLVDSGISDIGFHYDVIFKQKFEEQAFSPLEERMRVLIRQQVPIVILEMMQKNAANFFQHHKQKYRAREALADASNIIEVLQMGDFIDLCRHPCVESTDQITYFKLQGMRTLTIYTDYAGNLEVTRIHGTAFSDPMSLKRFLKKSEEAKKCNHVQIGEELQLFRNSDHFANCQWLPKGALLRHLLLQWLERNRAEYLEPSQPLYTPPLIQAASPDSPGPFVDWNGVEYDICPDPIPLHQQILTQAGRYHAFSSLLRDIPASQLCGLLNPPMATLDLNYVLCAPEDFIKILTSSLHFIKKTIKIFGVEHRWYLNANCPKEEWKKKLWKEAISQLEEVLQVCGIEYSLDKQGDVGYGPKVEARILDASGREWSGPFLTANMTGNAQVIWSAFGLLERWIAVLIEQNVGLPFWIAPEQVRILPVAERHADYVATVKARLVEQGFRCSVDSRQELLGEKVHKAEIERVPYSVVIGDKEVKSGLITVRSWKKADVQNGITLETLLEQLQGLRTKTGNLG